MLADNQLAATLLAEDMTHGDLTTEALGIANLPGVMEFRARFDCTIAGVTEADAVLRQLALTPQILHPSGTAVEAGALVLSVKGRAAQLHAGWKVAQNIMEYASGIATRTRLMVTRGQAINPHLVVACTRKNFPGAKALSINAVKAGGGVIHRLGLSETFLVFSNHEAFFPVREELQKALRTAVGMLPEKKLAVEVTSLAAALEAAETGIHVVQFDKISPEDLARWIPEIRSAFPNLTIAAAGGINADTVSEYAAAGIDVAVTSAVYNGNPMDVAVVMKPAR